MYVVDSVSQQQDLTPLSESLIDSLSLPFWPQIVKQLMYGFGDVPNPSNDAVNVLEDMLIEYLTDTVSHPCLYYLASFFQTSNNLNKRLFSFDQPYSAPKQLQFQRSAEKLMSRTFDLFSERMLKNDREWMSYCI